jgi:hypothetical protein
MMFIRGGGSGWNFWFCIYAYGECCDIMMEFSSSWVVVTYTLLRLLLVTLAA